MKRPLEGMLEVGAMAGQRSLLMAGQRPQIGPLHLPSLAGLDSKAFMAKAWFWEQFLDPKGQYEVMP